MPTGPYSVENLLGHFATHADVLQQVLITLLKDDTYNGHPAVQLICDSLPELLPSMYKLSERASESHSMRSWMITTTSQIFSAELTLLSCEDGGLHFNAKNATAEQLESFSIRKLAKTMEQIAPCFWSLLDTCLNADAGLRKHRDAYALKAEKGMGRDHGNDEEHEPAEHDIYYAEYGVIDELEDVPATASTRSLRSRHECLETIKKVMLMSIMVKSTNQKCNTFVSVIGLFAHSSKTPERLIETLAHAGLSISVNAINEAVSSLSEEASTKLRELGTSLTVSYAYDNFDVTLDVATPTVDGGGGVLAHLTSGTLLALEHRVTAEDLECSEELWKTNIFNLASPSGPKPDASKLLDLHPEEDPPSELTRCQHFQAWQFRHDLVNHGPEYFRQFEHELREPEPIEEIPVSKTCQTVPASAMAINQSTTKGNIDAVEHLLHQANAGDLEETPGVTDITKHVILMHGDLSTMEHIQSAQASHALEKTPWRRFQYVVFIPGLFHVKMACVDAIWRLLVEPTQSRLDASSTMEMAGVFRPQQTGKIGSNPGFWLMHDLVQQDGLAWRLDCWRVEVQRRQPGVTDLVQYAESSPAWDEICSILDALAMSYVAQGTFSRGRAPEEHDADFENSLLRNQYYLLYEEITHAMNSGDIGRVEDALGTWILLFKGCGKMKYCARISRFLTDLHFVYPERLQRAIRLNWLCNPRGKEGMFRGIDWLVERNNLYTKHIYGGQFSSRTIPYIIKESILIELYRSLHVNIEDNFCLTNRTINHTPANLTAMLAKADSWICKADPHKYQASRTVKYDIVDAAWKGAGLLMLADVNAMQIDEEEVEAADDVPEHIVQGNDLAV